MHKRLNPRSSLLLPLANYQTMSEGMVEYIAEALEDWQEDHPGEDHTTSASWTDEKVLVMEEYEALNPPPANHAAPTPKPAAAAAAAAASAASASATKAATPPPLSPKAATPAAATKPKPTPAPPAKTEPASPPKGKARGTELDQTMWDGYFDPEGR